MNNTFISINHKYYNYNSITAHKSISSSNCKSNTIRKNNCISTHKSNSNNSISTIVIKVIVVNQKS